MQFLEEFFLRVGGHFQQSPTRFGVQFRLISAEDPNVIDLKNLIRITLHDLPGFVPQSHDLLTSESDDEDGSLFQNLKIKKLESNQGKRARADIRNVPVRP